MAEKKSAAELLKEELCYCSKNAVDLVDDKTIEDADLFCEGYKKFLDLAKTERETVDTTISILREKGFRQFDPRVQYKPGDRVFYNNRGKALIFATIGEKPLTEGVRIVASHVDSPRLDLKPRPLYEDSDLALFKTHYYGGIKKYQWTALPLALHGVIVRKDGEKITVTLGEEEDDPKFVITDLLPHLGKEQMERKLKDGIRGEELNVLVGGRPFRDDKASERVKLAVLNILHEKYGVCEEDFLCAELTVVPAIKAADIGFDRSFVGAYGHDDRVCAYTSVMAGVNAKAPGYTAVTVLADKEETGSEGSTGLDSDFLRFFIEDLAATQGLAGRTVLTASKCLSADVNAAFDPTFPDVAEKLNTAFAGRGVVVTKYTGSGGKGGTNDASAEYMGFVRKLLDDAKIQWQIGELGKVDFGGGGTVAKFVSSLGVDTVDVGVPVLSMHAPFEVVSKTDVYMTFKAFEAFYR